VRNLGAAAPRAAAPDPPADEQQTIPAAGSPAFKESI
jgi:hypothetical protein